MAQRSNVQERLQAGIDAARRGDKINARRLLQQVLAVEKDNETAWMWMASVVETLNERRACLEKVLQINPNNERAREALRRLGGGSVEAAPAAARRTRAPEPTYRERREGGLNAYFIAAAAVVLLVALVAGVTVLTNRPQQVSPLDIPQTTQAVLFSTLVPTATSNRPTDTPIAAALVTYDPNRQELPPTFTPTVTLTPTELPPPSATPPPPSAYQLVYADFEGTAAQPSLYTGQADGVNEVRVGGSDQGFRDVAFDPTGARIAFVREVEGNPQLFVASLNALDGATQLTQLNGSVLQLPAFSPDGAQIVFTSNAVGREQLYLVSASGGEAAPLTNSNGISTDGTFSPDGTQIAYTSDQDSPGFTEIYVMSVDGESNRRLTNESGNNYSPTWSPDGEWIAFISDRGGDGDLRMIRAVGGAASVLLLPDDGGAEDRSPAWSPDSRYIAFASNRDGESFRWYLTDLQGVISPITQNDRNAQSLSFRTVGGGS